MNEFHYGALVASGAFVVLVAMYFAFRKTPKPQSAIKKSDYDRLNNNHAEALNKIAALENELSVKDVDYSALNDELKTQAVRLEAEEKANALLANERDRANHALSERDKAIAAAQDDEELGSGIVSAQSQKYLALRNRAKSSKTAAKAWETLATLSNKALAELPSGPFKNWTKPPKEISLVKAK